jgi:hypothetical protein
MDSIILQLKSELQVIPKSHQKPLESPGDDALIVTLLAALSHAKEDFDISTSQAREDRAVAVAASRRHLETERASYFHNLDVFKTTVAAELKEKNDQLATAQAELVFTTEATMKLLSRELGNFQLFYQARKAELTTMRIKAQSRLWKSEAAAAQASKQTTFPEKVPQAKPRMTARTSIRAPQKKSTLDEMLAIAIARRDQARAIYGQRGSRQEELSQIDALEAQLTSVSHQLTQDTRDLMAYRAHLQAQDEVYSAQFTGGRRTSLSMDARSRRPALPPLLQ